MPVFLYRYSGYIFPILLLGCANPQLLQLKPVAESFPLYTPQAYGSTIKQCVSYDPSGKPLLRACSTSVQHTILSTKNYPSSNPVYHTWGINQIGGKVTIPPSGLGVGGGFALANEILIYDTTEVTEWAESVSQNDFDSLMSLCANRSSSNFDAIVIKEDAGCSVVSDAGNLSGGIPKLSIEFLHNNGKKLGMPKDFLSDNPKSEVESSTISCTTKVPVQVQVMNIDGYCTSVVNPMYLRNLRKEIDDLRAELKNSKQFTIDQLRNQLANAEQKLRETSKNINDLSNNNAVSTSPDINNPLPKSESP